MADLSLFVQFLENRFKKEIKSHLILDPVAGEMRTFPKLLDERIKKVLKAQKIHSFYSHQLEAFEAICNDENTLLVSQTASGKTLSFFIPIINRYINSDSPFTVLLLYPTKALSRDQESTLSQLMLQTIGKSIIGTFDGDTPLEERNRILKVADFVISNPDMLHAGVLPNHNRRWKNFLSRLKYIVIDEVHLYRGAFGSHVSNVFRRLLRVCDIHGSKPTFVCSSATVGNPEEFVTALFHRNFHLIDRDGAPRPRRELYMLNPQLIETEDHFQFRKGPGSVAKALIRQSAKLGIRTICFCRARQQVERLYRAVLDGQPELGEIVKPYRGGLLPNERRKLERNLFNGNINTIISTNALELGIDIGDLHICILCGHPGSIASFWQQAGRVGRKDSKAIIIYIANNTPVDQYLVHNPDFITNKPVERAWLNGDNPYILLQHLPCASHEHPLRSHESYFDELTYTTAIDVLLKEKTIVPYREFYRYALRDYPTRGVNLRGITDHNIEIYCGSIVIGEIDPIGARGTLYKDAIYQHLGKRYLSLDLDLNKKLCRVEAVNVDYYTEAVWEGRISMIDIEQTQIERNSKLEFGSINVNKQPKLYKKIRERSFENIGYGPITLAPFIYDTTGFNLQAPKPWVEAMVKVDKRYVWASLFGLGYILKRSAPSLCMGDVNDIDTDVSLSESESSLWKSALFVFR